jgi:hypothetical protein
VPLPGVKVTMLDVSGKLGNGSTVKVSVVAMKIMSEFSVELSEREDLNMTTIGEAEL